MSNGLDNIAAPELSPDSTYSQAVEYNALNKIDFVFKNDGDEKASIVFRNIFKTASNEINIVACNLNNALTNSQPYLTALSGFLDKSNSKLHILLTKYEMDGSKIKELLERYKNRITIKTTEGKTFKDSKSGVPIHFCIADDRMYRFEYDVTGRKAQCNFNDPQSCAYLKEQFNIAFNSNQVKVCEL